MLSKIVKFISGSNLRNRFLLFFIVLATVPVLILGSLSLYLVDLAHKQDVSALELQLIDQKTEEIEKFLADTLGILELYVSTDQSYIEPSTQAFLLESLLAENKAFEEVSFIDLRGRESEKRICLFDEEPELFDVSRLERFKVPSRGESFVGEVYYTLNGPFITMASPVYNRRGEIISILSAEVNLSQVVRSIKTASLGLGGWLVLLDKNGAVIAHGSREDIPLGVDLSGLDRVKRISGGAFLDGLGERDRYESFFGSVPVVGVGKKVSSRLGWMFLAEWPIVDADAVINDVKDQVTTFTLVAIIIVLLLAPVFANRLTKPIHELESSAVEIEKGNFDKQVDIQTNDELEELGKAFNRMSKGLRRLQELKNEFVFIAAHELRTPVTAIKGYISMIFEGEAGPISKEIQEQYLQPVAKAAERLGLLINDILEIARSEAGRITVEVFSVDIRESIKAVLGEIEPLAGEKQISISYEKPKDLTLVLADTIRVKEVITNFLSNAIKYNSKGGWVKIYHEIDPKYITTHIADGGLGIPPKEQKHVFQKFFRSEVGKIKKIEGTGLGLFIVKELIEKMNGRVWFKSEEGKGTTFSFRLPRGK